MPYALIARALAQAAAQELNEEKTFRELLAAMPPEDRDKCIQSRREFRAEQQRQREHAEMVEAMKPHTLWSFLGLGSK